MAKIKLSKAPTGLDHYSAYLPWLERNFYRHICAYCFVSHTKLTVDHYEPIKMSPKREHDPTNLLPACIGCNGRGGKSDYHPKNRYRTKGKNDSFKVLDPRKDDLEKYYQLSTDGSILPISGRNERVAEKNILLFKLTKESSEQIRKEYFDIFFVVLELSQRIRNRRATDVDRENYRKLMDYILSRELFFHVFGVPFNREFKREAKKRPSDRRPLCVLRPPALKKSAKKKSKRKA